MSFAMTPDVAAPYPGLRPFLRDESVIFFGREQQIDDVLGRLKTHRFLGVVGTSGCGKSSLVRAGMLPALESGLMGELGSTWFVADMKPGDAPLTNLAKALINSGVFGERWSDTPEGIALLTAALRRSDVSLVNLIRQVQLPTHTNLLVLADQFEEIFRFRQQDTNEALAFVNLLLETSRDALVPIYVLLTMRTDFLGQCALFPGLPEALNDGQYLCPRLSRDQLAEAIEGPVAVFGATVEPALVTQLLNDAGANSDQLPLVQHVLARIWRACPQDGRGPRPESPEIVLRLKDYQDRGGLNGYSNTSSIPQIATMEPAAGRSQLGIGPGYSSRQNALSEHADEAYLSLGDSPHDSRVSGAEHKPSHKQLIAQMLFSCLAERGPSGQYVRRPVKVLDVAAVADCSIDAVCEVVEVFRREDRSFLVPPVGVTLTADTVLDISHEALIRQWQRFGGQKQVGEHESAQSWLEIEEQSRRHYRRLAEATENESVAGLLRNPELDFLNQWWEAFHPTGAWANICIKDSYDRTERFLQRSLYRATEEERAKQQEQQARIAAAEENAETMKRRLFVIAFVAAFAVLGMILAGLAWRESARHAADAKEQREKATEFAKTAAEEAFGALEAQRRAEAAKKEAEKNKAEADLQRISALRYKSQSLARGAAIVRNPKPQLGVLLAAESVRVWRDNQLPEIESTTNSLRGALQQFGGIGLAGHAGPVLAVAISLDGRWLVTGGADGQARIWDLNHEFPETTARVLTGHTGAVTHLAIDPNSRLLFTGSADGTVRQWDLIAGTEATPAVFETGGHAVTAMALAHDATFLVTGSVDAAVRAWDLKLQGIPHSLSNPAEAVTSLAISPDDSWFVTGGSDGTVRIFELKGAAPENVPRVLTHHKGTISSVAISPDGRWLATSCGANVAIFDLLAPNAEPRMLEGHQKTVRALKISPDSRWLVTCSEDSKSREWRLADTDPQSDPIVLQEHRGGVTAAAISADSRRLVTGGADGRAVLFQLGNETRDKEFVGHDDVIQAVEISPDFKWLVTVSSDGTGRLWNSESLASKTLVEELEELENLNKMTVDDCLQTAKRVVGRNLTNDEWNVYFTGEVYRKTFDDLGEPPTPHKMPTTALWEATAVFGVDSRERVTPTTNRPFNAICLLEMVSPNGTPLMATGAIIGNSTVLTAGHAVFNRDPRYGVGAMQKITVYAGRDKTSWQGDAIAVSTNTTKQWVNDGLAEYDYAAIQLSEPLGQRLGAIRFAVLDDSDLQNLLVNVSGYPADKNNLLYGTMWGSVNRIVSVEPQRIGHLVDTAGGMGGSPVLALLDDSYVIVGIHNYGGTSTKYATRINEEVFDEISSWVK